MVEVLGLEAPDEAPLGVVEGFLAEEDERAVALDAVNGRGAIDERDGDGGALGAVASAAAADHNALDDQSKMIVDRITVRFEGPQHVSEDAVMAHVKVRKNMAFDQHNLDSSIRSLYGTGLYDFVEAYKTLPSPGKMDIEFFLIPKYRISQIIFSGNSEFGAARLQRQISSYSGGPLDDREVKRDVDKIVKYYKDKGYSLAKVSYAIEKNDTNGTGGSKGSHSMAVESPSSVTLTTP